MGRLEVEWPSQFPSQQVNFHLLGMLNLTSMGVVFLKPDMLNSLLQLTWL